MATVAQLFPFYQVNPECALALDIIAVLDFGRLKTPQRGRVFELLSKHPRRFEDFQTPACQSPTFPDFHATYATQNALSGRRLSRNFATCVQSHNGKRCSGVRNQVHSAVPLRGRIPATAGPLVRFEPVDPSFQSPIVARDARLASNENCKSGRITGSAISRRPH